METIDEATEATEESKDAEDKYKDATEADVKVSELQEQLEQERKRHEDALKHCKLRVKESEDQHQKVQKQLEELLIQARTEAENSAAVDGEHWLNNGSVPTKVQHGKLRTAEKVLIRHRVKQAFVKNQKKK